MVENLRLGLGQLGNPFCGFFTGRVAHAVTSALFLCGSVLNKMLTSMFEFRIV